MVTRHTILTGAAAAVLAIALPLSAQDATIEDIAERSRQIRENAAEIVGQETIDQVRAATTSGAETYKEQIAPIVAQNPEIFRRGVELAQEMAGSHMDAARADGSLPGQAGQNQLGDIDTRYRIFISQKMPRGEIKELVQTYAGRRDVALVLRGALPGQKVGDLQKWLFSALGKVEQGAQLANITIDPEPYSKLGTDQVPVAARYGEEGNLIAYVLGTTDISWLEEQVSRGMTGNLGARGPTIKVGEVDMIEAMKRRAAAYDWKAAGKGAVKRYWERTPVHDLPVAQRRRLRELDPTFEVSRTITAPNGHVIAQAGERINPLQYMPFAQTLLIIDPADPKQVAWAKAQITSLRGTQVTLLASQVRSLGSLEDLGRASTRLGTRIFLMNDELKKKFQIEAIPTLVRQSGTKFLIDEQLSTDRPEGS